jgi:PhoH-like ATPase
MHSEVNIANCLTNEYLVVKNSDEEIVDKLKFNGEKYVQLSYKTINNEFLGKVKPINTEQELAFDLLQDTASKVKVLAGSAGAGKDYLMVSNALQLIKQNKYKKILWVRNNIEVKNTKQIGFLPGDKKDKLEAFAMPLADHLGGKDGLDMLINQGKIEVEHLGFLRGRDLRESIVYCSECENCTTEIVQLLLGRIGADSMLWMNGDYRQVDDKCFETNNGLKAAINKLKGNSLFGYVNLSKVERSETAQLAELLY